MHTGWSESLNLCWKKTEMWAYDKNRTSLELCGPVYRRGSDGSPLWPDGKPSLALSRTGGGGDQGHLESGQGSGGDHAPVAWRPHTPEGTLQHGREVGSARECSKSQHFC